MREPPPRFSLSVSSFSCLYDAQLNHFVTSLPVMWREFFYFVGRRVPNFGVAEGNPICRPIPWRSTRSGNRTEREEARRRLDQWERGRTGYPWVDAFLRQMRLEGKETIILF